MKHKILEPINDFRDAMQSNNVPHFDYHLVNPLSMRFGCIEMDGKVIHRIDNVDEFYYEFGYDPDLKKASMLPEEYISAKYIQNATCNFVVCIQIRIIKYLIKYSEEYCEQCKMLLDEYLNETVAKAVTCSDCRMKPICERLKISK